MSEFPPGQLTLHVADVLDFDFRALGPALRVIGNLPYNISSPLLFRLAEYEGQLLDLHVMLQREVVARMTAAPATPDYGRLTVMLQAKFASRIFVCQRVPSAGPRSFRSAHGPMGGEPRIADAARSAARQRSVRPGRKTCACSFGDGDEDELRIAARYRCARRDVRSRDFLRLATAPHIRLA